MIILILYVQKGPGMVVSRLDGGKNVLIYSAGQGGTEHYGGYKDKYSKFVYSSFFGFSVSRGNESLRAGSFDNTLALAEKEEENYRTRIKNEILRLSEDSIVSKWHPFPDVFVVSEIIPLGNWHIRIHKIQSERELLGYEGGFSVRTKEKFEEQLQECKTGFSAVISEWGSSAIVDLLGYSGQQVTVCGANTNLLFSRSLLPQLKAEIPNGDLILCSAVYCSTGYATLEEIKYAKPYIEDNWIIFNGGKIKSIF